MNDVLRRVVDLTLHLDRLLLLVAHFDSEDPEVAASQIQSDEVPLFLVMEMGGKSINQSSGSTDYSALTVRRS